MHSHTHSSLSIAQRCHRSLMQSYWRNEATLKICWIVKNLQDQDKDVAWTRMLPFFSVKTNRAAHSFMTNFEKLSVLHHMIHFKSIIIKELTYHFLINRYSFYDFDFSFFFVEHFSFFYQQSGSLKQSIGLGFSAATLKRFEFVEILPVWLLKQQILDQLTKT